MGLLDQFLAQHVDPAKRRLRGLLTDPMATLEQTAYNAVEQRLPGFADAADAQSVMPQMSGPALGKFKDLGLNIALGTGKVVPPEYRGSHTAPMRDSGAPAFDITGGGTVYPKDVYDMGAKWYGTGHSSDDFAFSKVRAVRGNPNADVVVFRAVPIDAPMDLNPGDWVSVSSQYARDHGNSLFGKAHKDWKMIRRKVKAKDIYTNGDSILEWGYDPQP